MKARPGLHRLAGALIAAALAGSGAGSAAPRADFEGVPRYDHVFVIVEENKDYSQILDPAAAPNIAGLAARYGNATRFFAEVHPSEANYVALLGGDTFGIHDDDAYYCQAGSTRPQCDGAATPGYVDHTIHAPHLGDQLLAAGRSWKGYYENLPKPGSLAVAASDPRFDNGTRKTALYASKHSGFMNFADVQTDPHRARRIVGFDQLDRDLRTGALPAFALIVPNQCNEMHGLHGVGVPEDCDGANKAALIRRGDAFAGELVRRIQATNAWSGRGNVAIVITFDEGAGKTREGCCGVTPDAPSNFGGGHIPTIVITNHGPRGLSDGADYNHYSLLRTLEDAFRLRGHLGHAAEADAGVRAMAPLFATPPTK
ncbi:MAG TPA: alkaline phosphatase family protein [Caulobacteraceae bacterium]